MKAVFVVGTGRSGTHFTVRLLNGFSRAHDPLAGNENHRILSDIATAAIHHKLPSKTTADYYLRQLDRNRSIFLDQHHPNLFFTRHWAELLGEIVFIYPRRPTHQIVASMLRHKGVLSWYNYAQNWRQRWFNKVPYPNKFFGLTQASDISKLPTHLLCAHRVIAHRMAYEAAVIEGRSDLRSVNYESLVKDPLAEFARVFTKSELEEFGDFTLLEKPNSSSLNKYRDVLDDRQVAEIAALERNYLKPNH
jgi:hypothetical protein